MSRAAGIYALVLQLSEIETEFQVVLAFGPIEAIRNQKGVGNRLNLVLVLGKRREGPGIDDRKPIVDSRDTHFLAEIGGYFFAYQELMLAVEAGFELIQHRRADSPIIRGTGRLLAVASITRTGNRMRQLRVGTVIQVQSIVVECADAMGGCNVMIRFECHVTVVRLGVPGGRIVVKWLLNLRLRNKTQNGLRYSADPGGGNDVSRERIADEVSRTVCPCSCRIVDLK